MPACIFLLPNSLPSPNEIKALGKDAYPPVLRNFLEGFGEPKVATIFENPALGGFASMQWVWMLLTQRENLAPTLSLEGSRRSESSSGILGPKRLPHRKRRA